VEQQTAIIYVGTKGLLSSVPVNKVREFEADFLSILEAKHKNVLNDLKAGKLTDEITNVLDNEAKELAKRFKA
jgi:F-type H+-transporting ATPase subunit alpha